MTHTFDSLFDNDSLLGDPNDLDTLVELRDEPDQNDAKDEDEGENDDGASDQPKSADDKPASKTVTRVKRPQPKLDPERLKGPRGLCALPKAFSDFKFYGKGHEAEDLSRVLARLEHWSHRLFPKMQFDDFLEKLEKLGSKKVVQAYVQRIRLGLEEVVDTERVGDSEPDEPANPPSDEPLDEFDRLLAEQVSFYQNTSVTSVPPTPSSGHTPLATSSASSSLSAEQRERIERNRKAAMEKRQQRLASTVGPATPSH